MIDFKSLLSIFFLTNVVKYIIFGIFKDFNDIILNLFQSGSITTSLYSFDNEKYKGMSNVALWLFFGPSPHNNINSTISYLDDVFHKHDHLGEHNTVLLDGKLYTNMTEYEDELNKIYFWFDTNKYILLILSVFGIVVVSVLCYLFYKSIQSMKCVKKYSTNTNDIIRVSDGTLYKINPAYWNPSLQSFVIKIALISYCNLSTLTLYEIIHTDKDTISLSFVAIVLTFFVIIGFPAYVLRKLYYNRSYLNDIDFSESYGPLYLYYKTSPVRSHFMFIILIKQVIYSIIINLSSDLTYAQNSLLFLTNLTFLLVVIFLKPYVNKLYQNQAILINLSLTTITLVNFGIIATDDASTTNHGLVIINISLHILTLVLYFVFYLVDYCRNRKKPRLVQYNDISDNDDAQLIPMTSLRSRGSQLSLTTFDRDNYVETQRNRLSAEIGRNMTYDESSF